MSDRQAFKESVRRIFPGDSSEYIEVAPDSDGLGMTEVTLRNPDGSRVSDLRLLPEVAPLVAEAIKEVSEAIASPDPLALSVIQSFVTPPEGTATKADEQPIDGYLASIRKDYIYQREKNGGEPPFISTSDCDSHYEIDLKPKMRIKEELKEEPKPNEEIVYLRGLLGRLFGMADEQLGLETLLRGEILAALGQNTETS